MTRGGTAIVFEYTVLFCVVSSIAQLLIYCAITGISPISSSRISRKFILSLVPEGAGTICELGAGWGSLAFPLAKQSKQFGDERVLAIELSSLPWLYVKLRSLIFRRPNLDIVRANFLAYPLPSDTKAVVCYLHSEMLEKARPVLEQFLNPGTIVISNVFDIPGWEPESVHRLEDSFCPQVYVYRVPEHPVNVVDVLRANEILVVTVANSTPKPIPVEAISTEAPHDSINIPYTVETQA